MSESEEKPGRYQRTTGGLIGSMIVAVVVVLGVVVFRETFRDTPEIEPEPVDYLPAVVALQESGRQVAYPPELPDGWMVTGVDIERGQRPGWSLAMLTDDDKYVGLRQRDEDIDTLVEEHIDADATEGDPVELDSALASEWATFSDEGGDHGYATTITTDAGEESLLVYGSAPPADLEALIGLLTLDPAAPAQS
ncbi:DUF4245 family protein [Nocardioides sp. W7]|uniref:DUF4245 family protein n=1 Tax=Nocardioides sp. W7 TaxID=2931390 RepID=UPI001FCFC15F|nr:DUF4245 family protein [Nocardioides sp. W7]